MSIVVEIYCADPHELGMLFALEPDPERDDIYFKQLGRYPMADFSLHLHLPDDLDHLCQALRKRSLQFPLTFREVLDKEVWSIPSESLAVLSAGFVTALAGLGEDEIEMVATNWAETFFSVGPFHQTDMYRAVLQLREVAQHAVIHKESLLLHLMG